MTMLVELRHRTHVHQLPEETADTSDNVSVEEPQEKLRVLQAENKQLRRPPTKQDARQSLGMRDNLFVDKRQCPSTIIH